MSEWAALQLAAPIWPPAHHPPDETRLGARPAALNAEETSVDFDVRTLDVDENLLGEDVASIGTNGNLPGAEEKRLDGDVVGVGVDEK